MTRSKNYDTHGTGKLRERMEGFWSLGADDIWAWRLARIFSVLSLLKLLWRHLPG